MRKLRQNSGQTLIEIAIGMTILSVVLLTATSAAVSSSQQGTNSYIDLLASEYTQEGIEQITLYRNYCAGIGYSGSCVPISNWAPSGGSSIRTLTTTGWGESNWSLSGPLAGPPSSPNMGSEDPFTPDRFTRYIQFTDVTDPTLASGGLVEWEAKVIVTWTDLDGTTQSESGSTVLSDWNGG